MPDYGLYFAADKGGYGLGWGAKVQATPDFPVEELGLTTAYPRVFYDWQDMGAPRGAIVIRLVEWAAEKIKAGKKVDLGCFGGHGRTGTFLALLFIEMEGMTAVEAMKAVWSRHCESAIETYAQKKFIYEFNGERAPAFSTPAASNLNSGVTKPTPKPNNYQSSSKLKRKELKSARRRTRVEIKACVTDAITTGVTSRKVFEEDGTIWMCSKCGHIKLGGNSFGGQRDAKWVIWCQGCYETNQHIRPESLFDLLEE